MGERVEVTRRLRQAYRGAAKAEKTAILDEFCNLTGLARSTARRCLTGPEDSKRIDHRSTREPKYSAQAATVLARVWKLMGCPSGKYMAAAMGQWLDALTRHGELIEGRLGYSQAVRAELEHMSPATIDRYLKVERSCVRLEGGSAICHGNLLRNSITIRTAADKAEGYPGFFEIDTVAHCGSSVAGRFAHTVILTDVHTGWVHLEVMDDDTHAQMVAGLQRAVEAIPFTICGLDCSAAPGFLDGEVTAWARDRDILLTRCRAGARNDRPTVDSWNGHALRRCGFAHRCDTAWQRHTLAQLWKVVRLKFNYFTPTRKPIGWSDAADGRRRRRYDTPTTPLDRLLESGTLSPAQQDELITHRNGINPANLTRETLRCQDLLLNSAR
ncbi:integrase [uncultured Cutibacterium sp.]|uniref:integrase n=1 Tax=uncultured Cutibacterium sp. TaxID=1912223 RepID=UPI002804577E|nr:integrase [uncultured Cutibacterium sp.]MDU1581484.1 integrase [Cutibacterium granulosum]